MGSWDGVITLATSTSITCGLLDAARICGFKFYLIFQPLFFLVRSLCQCSSVVANKVFWMAFPRNRQPAFSGGKIKTEACFGDWYFGDIVSRHMWGENWHLLFTSFHIYVRSSLTMWVGQHLFKVGHEHHLQSTIPYHPCMVYGIFAYFLPLKKHQAYRYIPSMDGMGNEITTKITSQAVQQLQEEKLVRNCQGQLTEVEKNPHCQVKDMKQSDICVRKSVSMICV